MIAEQNLGGTVSYWRTPAGVELDFVWERGRRRVGIEVKAARTWRREYGAPLAELRREGVISAAFGVYTGATKLKINDVSILPVPDFLRALTEGHVLA